MFYVSGVGCHLLPALPTLKAMLVKTVFMFRPLEAGRKKTFGDEAAEGLVMKRVIIFV